MAQHTKNQTLPAAMTKIIIIAIFVLVTGHGMAAGKLQPPSPAPLKSSKEKQPEPAKQAAPDKRGTLSEPFAVNILPAPDAERNAARQKKIADKKAANDRLLVQATIALAVITLFLVFFTALMWQWTRKLARHAMRTADIQNQYTQETLRIGEITANAATKSAEVSEQALKLTQRAYVGFEMFKIESFAPNSQPMVVFNLKNKGQTRAKLLKLRCSYAVAKALPETPKYPTAILSKPKRLLRPGKRTGGEFNCRSSPWTIMQQ